MAWSFPAEWEEALWAAAGERLPAAALAPRALAAAVARRTVRYTSRRERLAEGAGDPGDLAARALFFTVADAAKVAVPIGELVGRGLLPAAAPLRVLDVGAGAGAMTLGLAAALPGRALAVTAVDRDAAALAILARAVARGAAAGVALRTVAADVTGALPEGEWHLVLAGTVLNELPAAARAPLALRLVARLAPGGAAILIEPALRETARALHELRDALVARGAAHVFAPCTRTLAPCPALADPRDWCHEDRPFAPPPRLAALVRATGLRREGLKFAYLTLRQAADPLVVPPPGRRALRVVSEPLDAKGFVERIVCGEDGRARLRVLKREKSELLAALARTRRGDVVISPGWPGDTR